MFLSVLEAENSKIKVPEHSVPEGGLSWLADSYLLAVSSHDGGREREREKKGREKNEKGASSYKGTDAITMATAPSGGLHLNLKISRPHLLPHHPEGG